MKCVQNIYLFLSMILLVWSAFSAHAQESASGLAEEFAGMVIVTKGEVHALNAQQEKRPLKRGDNFYKQDTIQTGSDSSVSLRFTDGTLLELTQNSTFKINDYHFNLKDPHEDSYSAQLIEGGFRTITGELGKRSPNNYEIKARMTTLTVRGTEYIVVFDGSNLVTFTNQGVVVAYVGGKSYTFGAGAGGQITPNRTVTPINVMPAALMKGFTPGGFKALQAQGDHAVNATDGTSSTILIEGTGRSAPPSGNGESPCQGISSMRGAL